MPATDYLLDTNILVHLIRENTVGQTINRHFSLLGTRNRSFISVVTVGEMYSLTRQWNWKTEKTARLSHLLGQLVWIDIN